MQSCALRKITRTPKVPNYENQVAQQKAYMQKVSLSGRPKAKVSRLRHPGSLRAQPWDVRKTEKKKLSTVFRCNTSCNSRTPFTITQFK